MKKIHQTNTHTLTRIRTIGKEINHAIPAQALWCSNMLSLMGDVRLLVWLVAASDVRGKGAVSFFFYIWFTIFTSHIPIGLFTVLFCVCVGGCRRYMLTWQLVQLQHKKNTHTISGHMQAWSTTHIKCFQFGTKPALLFQAISGYFSFWREEFTSYSYRFPNKCTCSQSEGHASIYNSFIIGKSALMDSTLRSYFKSSPQNRIQIKRFILWINCVFMQCWGRLS